MRPHVTTATRAASLLNVLYYLTSVIDTVSLPLSRPVFQVQLISFIVFHGKIHTFTQVGSSSRSSHLFIFFLPHLN